MYDLTIYHVNIYDPTSIYWTQINVYMVHAGQTFYFCKSTIYQKMRNYEQMFTLVYYVYINGFVKCLLFQSMFL